MQIQKTPCGALYPYYYKNGELCGLHLGSYFADEDRLMAMMKAEEEFFARQHRRLGFWIDFYETRLTDRVVQAFVKMIAGMGPQVTKLGIVGCSTLACWKINRVIRKTNSLSTLPVKYFEDPEVAKTWLVSELE